MTRTSLINSRGNLGARIGGLFFVLLLLWLGLNYRQLYFAVVTRMERERLVYLAARAPIAFQNPLPVEDRFHGELSTDFWKFTTINGGGKISNGMAWHSAAIVLDRSLTIQHLPDPPFKDEGSNWHAPAADQYNNVSLIGQSGFRPAPSRDVVLKFTAWTSEEFYGSAGVVFQPVGTLQKDGVFAKPFDMFGFAVAGKESSVLGISGPLCYLSLDLFPVQAKSLQVDARSLHAYEIRLRWVNQTEWLGSVKVDDAAPCQISMPAFGPVEVHVWSDNAFAPYRPRRWWEIAPAAEFGYQDGGNKQFSLGMIQIFEEKR